MYNFPERQSPSISFKFSFFVEESFTRLLVTRAWCFKKSPDDDIDNQTTRAGIKMSTHLKEPSLKDLTKKNYGKLNPQQHQVHVGLSIQQTLIGLYMQHTCWVSSLEKWTGQHISTSLKRITGEGVGVCLLNLESYTLSSTDTHSVISGCRFTVGRDCHEVFWFNLDEN